MANIKSAKKRIKTTVKRTLRNKMIKSALKTTIKKYEISVANKNVEEAKTDLLAAIKAIDMATSKGVLHRNNAARKKSRLSYKLKALNA